MESPSSENSLINGEVSGINKEGEEEGGNREDARKSQLSVGLFEPKQPHEGDLADGKGDEEMADIAGPIHTTSLSWQCVVVNDLEAIQQ